jgi:hypothetical protein
MSMLLVAPWAVERPLRKTAIRKVDDLVRVAEELRADPELLCAAVGAIAADPRRCADVAARSYWHPNGFAKIKVFEHLDYSLRLHLWPEGEDRRGDMNPHGHRWAFASWLLLGAGVVEKYFEEAASTHPDGVEYKRYRYRRRVRSKDLRNPEVVHLREIEEIVRPAGSTYSCTPDRIHTIDPIGRGLLVTMVVQGASEAKATRVYVRDRGLDTQRRRPLPADQLAVVLGNLETAMRRTPRS